MPEETDFDKDIAALVGFIKEHNAPKTTVDRKKELFDIIISRIQILSENNKIMLNDELETGKILKLTVNGQVFDFEKGVETSMPENKIDALIEKCRSRIWWQDDSANWERGEFLAGAAAAYLKEHGLGSEFDTEGKMVDLLSQIDKEYLHSEPDCPLETNVEFAVQRCREREMERTNSKEVNAAGEIAKDEKQYGNTVVSNNTNSREETKMAEETKAATQEQFDEELQSFMQGGEFNPSVQEEKKMEENSTVKKERKTEDIVKGDDIMHPSYDCSRVEKGYIIGEPKIREVKKEATSEYEMSFKLSAMPLVDGKAPENTEDGKKNFISRVRIRSAEPFDKEKIAEYQNGARVVSVPGQVFHITRTDKETHEKVEGSRLPYLYGRSMLDGETKAPIISKEQTTGREFYLAAQEMLRGVVRPKYEKQADGTLRDKNVFNTPMVNSETHERYGYGQSFYITVPSFKDGEPVMKDNGRQETEDVHVSFISSFPLEKEKFVSTKDAFTPVTMKGAFRDYDYKDKEGNIIKSHCIKFEPIFFVKSPTRDVSLGKAKVNEAAKDVSNSKDTGIEL